MTAIATYAGEQLGCVHIHKTTTEKSESFSRGIVSGGDVLKAAAFILTAGIAWQSLPAQTDSLSHSSAARQVGQQDPGGRVDLSDSAQPAMPPKLFDYRRVRTTKVVGDGVPGMVYQYARGQDLIDVFVMQYDPARALRTQSRTHEK